MIARDDAAPPFPPSATDADPHDTAPPPVLCHGRRLTCLNSCLTMPALRQKKRHSISSSPWRRTLHSSNSSVHRANVCRQTGTHSVQPVTECSLGDGEEGDGGWRAVGTGRPPAWHPGRCLGTAQVHTPPPPPLALQQPSPQRCSGAARLALQQQLLQGPAKHALHTPARPA